MRHAAPAGHRVACTHYSAGSALGLRSGDPPKKARVPMSPNLPAHATPLRRAISPLAPDAATLERFLAQCHRRRYPTRTDVFRPGDPAGTLYYVVNGSVSIITEEDDGRELVLGYLGAGEFVGEMGLFIETERREVALRTRTPCELAEISYERLYQLLLGPLVQDAPDPLHDRRPALAPAAGYQPQGGPPGLPRRHRPHRAHAARPGPRAGVDEPSAGHAAARLPPGARAPGRLLARNGRPRAEEAGSRGQAARPRQDRRPLRDALRWAAPTHPGPSSGCVASNPATRRPSPRCSTRSAIRAARPRPPSALNTSAKTRASSCCWRCPMARRAAWSR